MLFRNQTLTDQGCSEQSLKVECNIGREDTEGWYAGSPSVGVSWGMESSSRPEEERGNVLRSCSPSQVHKMSPSLLSLRLGTMYSASMQVQLNSLPSMQVQRWG